MTAVAAPVKLAMPAEKILGDNLENSGASRGRGQRDKAALFDDDDDDGDIIGGVSVDNGDGGVDSTRDGNLYPRRSREQGWTNCIFV